VVTRGPAEAFGTGVSAPGAAANSRSLATGAVGAAVPSRPTQAWQEQVGADGDDCQQQYAAGQQQPHDRSRGLRAQAA